MCNISWIDTNGFGEVEPFLKLKPMRNFSHASSWSRWHGMWWHWSPRTGHDKHVNEDQIVICYKVHAESWWLYSSVKTSRQTNQKKNADLLWIQESSSHTILFNRQRNGRNTRPLNKPCVLSPATRALIRKKQHSVQGHNPCDTAFWVRTLNLNLGSDTGSAMYCLCFMGRLFHLLKSLCASINV